MAKNPHLEPDAQDYSSSVIETAIVSIAVSLKRIADMMAKRQGRKS